MKLIILLFSCLCLSGCYTNSYEMKIEKPHVRADNSVKVRIAKVSLKDVLNNGAQEQMFNNQAKINQFFKSLNLAEVNRLGSQLYPQLFSSSENAIPCDVEVSIDAKVSAHSSMFLYFLTLGILPGGWEDKQNFTFNSKLDFEGSSYSIGQARSNIKGLWLVSVWTPSALVNIGKDKNNEISFVGQWGFFKDKPEIKTFFTKIMLQSISSQIQKVGNTKLKTMYLESI